MKNKSSIGLRIRVHRLARPLCDGLLLIAAMVLFFQIQSISTGQQNQQAAQITHTLNQSKLASHSPQTLSYTEQTYDSEPAMWQGLFLWASQSNGPTGGCQIQAPDGAEKDFFYLLCIGETKSNSTQQSSTKVPEVLEGGPVFLNRPAINPVSRKEAVATGPDLLQNKEAVTVRGWLQLPGGVMRFDPILKKWTR